MQITYRHSWKHFLYCNVELLTYKHAVFIFSIYFFVGIKLLLIQNISDCIDQYKQFWNCQLNGILLLIFFRIWNFVYVLQAMYPSSFCLSDRYKQQSYSLTHSRQKNFILPRKSLKIPKGQSESVYRRTDNTMAKSKYTEGRTTIYKTYIYN